MENTADLLKIIAELRQEITNLKQEKSAIEAELSATQKAKAQSEEKYLAEIKRLNQKLNEAMLASKVYLDKYKVERVKVFVPKTERISDIVIDEAEQIKQAETQVKKVAKKTNLGKKYSKRDFDYEKYVSEVKIIEDEAELCEKCGEKLVYAGEKIRYAIEVEPAKVKVTKIIKKLKKCPVCNKETGKIYYPLSKSIDGSILTSSLAAHIIYAKYELGIPFHHLENYFRNSIGFAIPKQNLANYACKVSNILAPVFDKMKEDLLYSRVGVIHSDETTLTVSKPTDASRKTSYVYVYTSSFYDPRQIRIYDFHETRSCEPTTRWLENFNGVVVCDNFSGYNKMARLNPKITLQKCWAHVRRRFADIVKGLSAKDKDASIANRILIAIGRIFDCEKRYRKQELYGEALTKARQRDMKAIKSNIYGLVFGCNPAPKSLLETAINYTKACWDELFTFVDNPYVEPTNNTAERAVKPFVINRKVFQTAGSNSGAAYTTRLFSIVQTCNINNIDVESYFNYVLENVDQKPIDDLLPYSENIRNKFFCNLKTH